MAHPLRSGSNTISSEITVLIPELLNHDFFSIATVIRVCAFHVHITLCLAWHSPICPSTGDFQWTGHGKRGCRLMVKCRAPERGKLNLDHGACLQALWEAHVCEANGLLLLCKRKVRVHALAPISLSSNTGLFLMPSIHVKIFLAVK